jgi:hypothetical protein
MLLNSSEIKVDRACLSGSYNHGTDSKESIIGIGLHPINSDNNCHSPVKDGRQRIWPVHCWEELTEI